MNEAVKGADVVILLAAEHRDDVTPVSLYYDTNVGGMEVTLKAMEKNGCKHIVFFSSVAVYGLNKKNPDESNLMASRNGRQRSCCRSGMSCIPTGPSTSYGRP